MMRKNRLTMAVSAAVGLTAAAAFPQVVNAQEETLEEVVVTGSRIRSNVADTPRPVTTLDSMDLELSGISTVSEALRQTTFNSLGSYREQSGSSFGGVALIDLKGLGADRTAVLINGRRVPGNPLTGTAAVDLNTIPMSAVERIEILTDSASAVYGADAIGGVVNVIMKREFTGAEIRVGKDIADRDDAEGDRASATFGMAGDKGSVLFSLDYLRRDPVFDVDRDYSSVQVFNNPNGGDPRHAIDTRGVSSGGNTGFTTDFGQTFRIGGACGDAYVPLTDPEGIPGEGCGYGYADISMQTAGLERKSSFLDARYEITDDHELYLENRFTKNESIGRYAPAVGFFLVDEAAPLNDRGEDFFLFHRFIAHGNRDDQISYEEFDSTLGVNGSLFNDEVNYDFYGRYYEYTSRAKGQTYIITSIIEDLVADGSYNFLDPTNPDNESAVQQSAATLSRDIFTEYTNFGLTFDGAFGGFNDLDIGWAAGAEWAEEEYQDQYDSFREAGNVIGSSGNSSAGDRERWAAFAEFQIPIFENFTVNVAGRYDDYSDFDSEFSPQISGRWDVTDWAMIRASWGEGFKAPNLGDIGQSLSQSFEDVTDLVRCDAQGIPEDQCNTSQAEEYTGGNPDLLAETSESFNVGVLLTPTDGLSFSLDWWNVEVEDAISTLDLSDVIELERKNQLPPGVIVNRGPTVDGVPGNITRCAGGVVAPNCGIINVFANLATLDVEGLDLRVEYVLDTSFGQWRADATWSHYLTYDEQVLPGGDTFDRPGTAAYPEDRANFNLYWSMSDFNVVYTYSYIAEHEDDGLEEYDSWDKHDINGTWTSPWGLDFSLGVKNLTDEDPSVDNISGWTAGTSATSTDLYPVAGRVYTANLVWRL